MSIEDLLTVGLAAGLLVAAALLRLFVLGAIRLFFKVSGRELPVDLTEDEAAVTERIRRPVVRPALDALGAAGRGLVYVLATVGTWMATAIDFIVRAAASIYASLSPRVAKGTERGVVAAAAKAKSVTVVSIATAQHVAGSVTQRVKQLAEERAARREVQTEVPEEVPEGRVIRLDREWDPLTDPLEDQPISNYR